MPLFRYTARDSSGSQTRGTVEAVDRRSAVAALRERGLWPTALQEAGGGGPRGANLQDVLLGRASAKLLAVTYRQLAAMLGAGMNITHALRVLSATTPNRRLARALGEALAAVESGSPLADGMATRARLFGGMEVAMVRAGEASGHLESMLNRAADHLEFEHRLWLRVRKLLVYPAIMLIALIIVPPLPVLVLQGPVPYLRCILPNVLGLAELAACLLALRAVSAVEPVGRALDAMKLAVPVLGTVLRRLALARFFRAVADLYSAGVSLFTAVELAAGSCGNRALGAGLRRALLPLRDGVPLSRALATAAIVGPDLTQVVATAEESGSIDEMLGRVASNLESEASAAIDAAVPVLAVLFWAALAIPLILQIFAMAGGYVHTVTNAVGE